MPLQIIRQDITKMNVDAIVNTTNEEMIGYDGVDLAVHTKAGPMLDEVCSKIAPIGLGEAKITHGYNLPCRYIIHTSGPIWQGGLQAERIILRSCYRESLKLAVKHRCESVAFPLISSGAYGYPKDQVLKFAVKTISEFLFEHELNVYLCVYDKESYSFSKTLFNDIREYIGDDYIEHQETDFSAEFELRRKNIVKSKLLSSPLTAAMPQYEGSARGRSLHDYVNDMDVSFREMLFDLIDKSGMTDVECYKRANVDKRTFSKIKSSKDYRPSKQTAIAFAIALCLDIDQTQALLATLGYTLSRSFVFDKIIRYFIHNKNYNIFEINEALFEFDQTLLGSF